MRERKLRIALVAFAIGLIAMLSASAASAATLSSSYPADPNARDMTAPNGWSASTEQSSVDLLPCLAPITCPAITNSTANDGGAHGDYLRTDISGVASVISSNEVTWQSPEITYNGAGGLPADELTFALDRRVVSGGLLALLDNANFQTVIVDTSAEPGFPPVFAPIDDTPLADQDWIRTQVSIDPEWLTIGNTYVIRIITRLAIPVGVIPGGHYDYDNVELTATAEDPDPDGDGVESDDDNCPDVANPEQEDLDEDELGDACDEDIDGDGVPNAQEPGCPAGSDPDNADSDGDGVADGTDALPCDADETTDTDADGIGDNSDNCAGVANPGQEDTDGDSIGDACDTDRDGDGVADGTDNCINIANPGQENLDNDALGDACDPDIDGDGVPNDRDSQPRNPSVSSYDENRPPVVPGQGATVRIRVKCPKKATVSKCRVKAVARLSRSGPRITNTVKRKVKRGKKKVIVLRVKPQYVTAARQRGRVTVLRFVKTKAHGKKRGKKRFVGAPVL